ncbi:hypothetical protein DL98DRAFT_595283 [Cadophora sp. DSE1049]|nr:hypothetical protein DL98DRAFT_595283 [Cadophora sp. DSE1049]
MALKFTGSRLEIMPVCLGSININDTDLRFLNNFTATRFCQCSLEILYQPVQGVEKRIHRDEQLCHITEYPDDGIANAIGLQFKSPFYVDANCLLVPSMATAGGIVMAPAAQYEIRFQFAVQDHKKWLPMSLHQLFGLDPSQWQPTANLNNGVNPSLWARGYHPLTNIGNGHNSALHRIRVEYKYGGSQELQSCQTWQLIVWDLRVHCRWMEHVPSNSPSALANVAVPTIKVPEPSTRPRSKAQYNPRERAYNAITTRRRSKRLENKDSQRN